MNTKKTKSASNYSMPVLYQITKNDNIIITRKLIVSNFKQSNKVQFAMDMMPYIAV